MAGGRRAVAAQSGVAGSRPGRRRPPTVSDPPRGGDPDRRARGWCRGARPAGGRRHHADRRRPGQPDQRSRRPRRSHGGGARRLPRHRRGRRPRGGDLPPGQPASAGHAGDDHPGRPAAPAVPSSCAWRARRGAGRGPEVHHRRSGGVPQRGDGAAAGARTRCRARGAHRGVGGRAAAGGPVGTDPWRLRRLRRRRRVRRGLLRKPSVRPRLPRRGGPGPAAGRGTRVPARHLRARRADRPALRRPDRSLGRPADAGDPRAREPVRRPARRRAPVVPLPPPLRRRVAGPAGCPACRPGREAARRGQPVARRERAARRCRTARDRERRPRAHRRPRRAQRGRPAPTTPGPHPPRVAGRAARGRRTSPTAARQLRGVEPALRGRLRRGGGVARRRRGRSRHDAAIDHPRARARWPRRPGTGRARSAPSRP